MFSPRRSLLAPAALVLALSLTPALTACGPLQGLVENATGGQVNLGGPSVPSDFPSDIPLAAGEIINGASIGDDEGKVWNIAVKVADASAIDGITAQLTGAGFEKVGETQKIDAGSSTIFSKDPYGVIVLVAKDDKGGFVANYTVTYTKPGS